MSKRKKERTERRRVKREEVKQNAASGGKNWQSWYALPKGVTEWKPEKAGRFILDILPYEVADKKHPDRVGEGFLWYKRPFAIHKSVGVNNEAVVCPKSIGKPCPICEHRETLNWDKDEDPEEYRAEQIQALDELAADLSMGVELCSGVNCDWCEECQS